MLIEVNDNRFLSSMLVHHKTNTTHGLENRRPMRLCRVLRHNPPPSDGESERLPPTGRKIGRSRERLHERCCSRDQCLTPQLNNRGQRQAGLKFKTLVHRWPMAGSSDLVDWVAQFPRSLTSLFCWRNDDLIRTGAYFEDRCIGVRRCFGTREDDRYVSYDVLAPRPYRLCLSVMVTSESKDARKCHAGCNN
jgi:hypothetical protein